MGLRSHGSLISAHRLSAVLPLLLLASACGEPDRARPEAVRTDRPAGTPSESRWTTVRPGGETACASDSEYRFFAGGRTRSAC